MLIKIFLLNIIFFLLLFILTLLWGTNQALNHEIILSKLKINMNLDDAKKALPVDFICKKNNAENENKPSTVCQLSRAGIGSWLAPQHNTYIRFDKEGNLKGCNIYWYYQLDEIHESVALY